MLERPEGDRRHITWRVAVVAVLLLLLVGGIVRLVGLKRATDVYQDQSVLSARTASKAIRLGHDAQRYVIMDWRPQDTSPMWMVTYLNLRNNLESLVSDARRLPHAADTRQVLQDVVSSWDIVESKVHEAQRNLDELLAVPELVEELQDKSLLVSVRRTPPTARPGSMKRSIPEVRDGNWVSVEGRMVRSRRAVRVGADVSEGVLPTRGTELLDVLRLASTDAR